MNSNILFIAETDPRDKLYKMLLNNFNNTVMYKHIKLTKNVLNDVT